MLRHVQQDIGKRKSGSRIVSENLSRKSTHSTGYLLVEPEQLNGMDGWQLCSQSVAVGGRIAIRREDL